MKNIFFIFLSITFLLFLFYKKSKTPIILLLLIFLSLLIIYPKSTINGAKEGINLWLFVVIPSLLPFFIVNDMLISVKVPENIARLFTPAARFLFNTSGYGAYAFIMSIFSGYPSGAKIVSDLIESKNISTREGQKILTFSSTSGPLFIIGAVGSGMLKSTMAGYILYISHVLGAVINGIIFKMFLRENPKKGTSIRSNVPTIRTTEEMLSKAILNSLYTSAIIGGYIILFSVIIYLLNEIEYFHILNTFICKFLYIPKHTAIKITDILETSLEISNGSKIIASMQDSFLNKMLMLSFIIGFSGLSVIGQVSGIVNKSGINIKLYMVSKIFHGLFSSIICYFLLNLVTISCFSSSSPNTSVVIQGTIILDTLLILMLFLNLLSNKSSNRNI